MASFLLLSHCCCQLFLPRRSSRGNCRWTGTAPISQWSPTCPRVWTHSAPCCLLRHPTLSKNRGAHCRLNDSRRYEAHSACQCVWPEEAPRTRELRRHSISPPSQQQNISMLANMGAFRAPPNPLTWQRLSDGVPRCRRSLLRGRRGSHGCTEQVQQDHGVEARTCSHCCCCCDRWVSDTFERDRRGNLNKSTSCIARRILKSTNCFTEKAFICLAWDFLDDLRRCRAIFLRCDDHDERGFCLEQQEETGE